MNIQPINIYNPFSTQNLTLRRDKAVQNYRITPSLKCDTVTFTSVAKSEPLKRLLKFGIPDFYSNVTLVDPQDLEQLLQNKIFYKPIRNLVGVLNPYEDSLFPTEKQVYRLMKKTARKHPNMFLDEFLHKLVPEHSKLLLEQQRPVFDRLSKLAANMPEEQILKYNHLIDITSKKLLKEPVVLPFYKKELLYKLEKIKERIVQNDNFNEIGAINKIIRKVEFLDNNIGTSKKVTPKELKQFSKLLNFFNSSCLKCDKDLTELLYTYKARLLKIPYEEKFYRKGFIHDLENITNQLTDKKLAHTMIQTARELPTSKNSLSALIVKEANRSPAQIGYDLLADSVGSADHLVTAKAGGDSDICNYVLASRRYNSERAHSRLETVISKNPKIREYAQSQVDRLIALVNLGVFKVCKLDPSYIRTLARKVNKLSPKDSPLILDTNKLKY